MARKNTTGNKSHHTVLFKKILSSFFAKEAMIQLGMNPASMFVSFVSSKQFFGLIHRRMTEHYKLNLFDINLDSFDVRIGFGDDPTITVKNIDIYYAYNSSANFVGYKNYNPSIIATGLAMFFSAQTVDLFEDETEELFSHFLYTIYFLTFLFIAKIKVFPKGELKDQFDWFVQVFRSFYELVFHNTGKILKKRNLQKVKELLIHDVKVMFSLFHIFKQLNQYFYVSHEEEQEMISWLLAGELHHKTHEKYSKQYIELYRDLCQSPTFNDLEQKIIDLIVPADILIRYLFGDGEAKLIAKNIMQTIYPFEKNQEVLETFIIDGGAAKKIIEDSIDFTIIKKEFFFGLQQYVKTKIQEFSSVDKGNEEDIEALDDFLSYLSENDQIDINALPKNIQVQSITFDKLINFYISFIGGFWIARGDNGYLRLYKPELLRTLLTLYPIFGTQHESVQYYAKFFRLYEKNVFYYQYVFNHIRSGKDSFLLPTQSSIVAHDSNLFIIQLLNESYWSIILQDFYSNEIKLYIKKAEILDIFKKYFGNSISQSLQYTKEHLIKEHFSIYNHISTKTEVSDLITTSFDNDHITHFKNHMYCIDFWIVKDFIDILIKQNIHHHYDNPTLLAFFATIKETLFGFLLYLHYVQSSEHSHQKDYLSKNIIDLYCKKILHTTLSSNEIIFKTLENFIQNYDDIFALWTLLDDNQDYMYIGFNNWTVWIEQHHHDNIVEDLSDDDVIWFLGYLKQISYYNKRFLIPDQII